MARPSKFTPERAQTILDAVAIGSTHRLACLAAGISEDTLANWQRRYSDFSDALKIAEGKAVMRWLRQVEAGAEDGAWQAAAWKLERRYPQEYGRKVNEIQGKDGGPVRVGRSVEDLSNDELAAIVATGRIALGRGSRDLTAAVSAPEP